MLIGVLMGQTMEGGGEGGGKLNRGHRFSIAGGQM